MAESNKAGLRMIGSEAKPATADDSMVMIGPMRLYDMIKWVHALLHGGSLHVLHGGVCDKCLDSMTRWL